MPKKFFFIIYLLILLNSCSSNKETIYEPSIKINPYESYKAGMDAFEKNDYFFASKKFTLQVKNFLKQN